MRLTRSTFAMLFVGLIATGLGCTEGATQKDVAKAERNVREEQQDVREAQREGQEKVADARRDADYKVNRPVIEEANRDVAEARRDAAENVVEEKRDVREAQAELSKTQRELQATQGRDQFAREAQSKLDDAAKQIDLLKERAKTLEGAPKDQLDQRISALEIKHDAADDALGEMKRADLANWTTHRTHVQTALADLTRDLEMVR